MQTQKMSLANIKGKLSRAEMKNVKGGVSPTIYCCDGTKVVSTNNCSNSVGTCNDHGGVDYCMGGY